MLPSSSLNLIPVHISRPPVVFARPRPPVSGEPFSYAIVYPRHSKGNRELPIVAVRSPKRRMANKLLGKRGGRQTAAIRARGHPVHGLQRVLVVEQSLLQLRVAALANAEA